MKSLLRVEAEERFATEFGVFARVAGEHAATLGLSEAQVAALDALSGNLEAKIGAVAAARAAWLAAVTEKDEAFATARKLAGQYSRQWRADPEIPDALITELQLAPKEPTKTFRLPSTPTRLSLQASGDGEILLRWEKGENPRGVVYMVQRADSASGPWTTVEVTTERRATVFGTPGSPIWLRVVAKVRRTISSPTLPVSVWADVELRRAA